MREIKFRQPLFIKGKFSRFHYWGFISKGNFTSPINDWIDGEASQQYTGLNDKNGVEIYEWDIVKFGVNYPVYFDDKFGCWALKEYVAWKKEYRPVGHRGSSTKYSPYLWNWLSKKCEVIGNIHENPELLTP